MQALSSASETVFAQRRAGVLLPLSALSGSSLHGDLGRNPYDFIDFIATAGFSVWQMLPLGPVNASGSPYQTFSLLAGDPRHISLPALVEEGLLEAGELQAHEASVLLALARRRCQKNPQAACQQAFTAFREQQGVWLHDYAVFMSLRGLMDGRAWPDWPAGLRDRCSTEIRRALRDLQDDYEWHMFAQFVFARQWQRLKAYARSCGVYLFGDMPIYPAHNSADVWTMRDGFDLDANGLPRHVAGTPPDAFSADGQCWGNPVYNWAYLFAEGFGAWLRRLRMDAQRFDVLRLDHFRGLQAFWAIPSRADSAASGQWYPAHGRELLQTVRRALPDLTLVAEDLGTISPDVIALRDEFHLPGMHVLLFAFDGDPVNPHLPANHRENAVVYTGTHDNDTTLGWWRGLSWHTREQVVAVTGSDAMPWALLQLAVHSVARLAIIPLQDCLALGSEARTNTPGTHMNNWCWRVPRYRLTPVLSERLYRLLESSARVVHGNRYITGRDDNDEIPAA